MNNEKSNSPISNDDKEKLIKDLKETFKDVWVIGKKLLNPIIDYINWKYDGFSQEKKDKIKNIVDNAKQYWEKWISKIRELIWLIKK